jgi:hypothetical protein
MKGRRAVAAATVAALVLLVGACTSGGHEASIVGTSAEPTIETTSSSPACSATGSQSSPGYPNSIAVLGHSGATGENSDPSQPGVEVRENSWATGTNPAVNSPYLRILAKNPKIEGCNFNLAQGGATVQDLVSQAEEAVSLNPKPALVVVQIMDNDLVCPATAADYAGFRSTFISALDVLAKGAPHSSFFVVSQFGGPGTYAKALTLAERQTFGGTGPCDFVDPNGRIVPKKVARLDDVIHGYEAQLEAACKRFTQCHYDGGAFGDIVDRREYVSSDLNHFSIKGHAKAAAVAWAAMQRAGLVPKSG